MSGDKGPCFAIVESAAIGVAVAFMGVCTYGVLGALWRRLFPKETQRRVL